jgi:hypothetical protein
MSCRSILDLGTAECYTEFDAATNSGKDAIKQITETVQYDSFSGKRRIFLIDEAHRLSKDALDALLKPMEDTVQGSQNKLMVCIFCTTEPEKMRATIFSRCAPAFVIRKVPPEIIADRLAFVCAKEGIEFEREALVLIGAAVESHIRDALKAVEGISMLGAVSVANTASYLRLNTHPTYIEILTELGSNLTRVLQLVGGLEELVSPSVAYEKLAELSMLAFAHTTAGRKTPVYWDAQEVQKIGEKHSVHLLNFAGLLAGRPSRCTFAMLACDLATLHFRRTGEITLPASAENIAINVRVPEKPTNNAVPQTTQGEVTSGSNGLSKLEGTVSTTLTDVKPSKPYMTQTGVYIDPRAINRSQGAETHFQEGTPPPLDPSDFKRNLLRLVAELNANGNRR